ncbi:MAG: spore maturation protein [Bacteroidetes bacterium]|jgi:spore maturation protein SpmA|nr:spore maturation protein [Bacteroidota bacterium]MBT5528279.1 spore maturation protein [Cytophagia bacterium]MBT3801475.1 spore maturation protein [Bacteroidota bacterium]MBT3933545.1 spore maturation protein [Bacteroidota bacterium]MBT4339983.1 spore maturation protein [Bacteroidota bacterium]
MVLNYIWIAFFLIAFVVALLRLIFLGDLDVFPNLVNSTFEMAEASVKISIYLIGIMALWLGIMRIGEKGGAVKGIARVFNPLFSKLFPEIPKNHPSIGSMIMNISANMLGLDNAATPLGLKAMKELQEINPSSDTASNAQILFLVLNTSGLTIIPVSIMALRAANGAANPSDVFLPILLATFFSSMAGLIAVSVVQRINLFNKVVVTYLGSAIVIITALIWYFSTLQPEAVGKISTVAGNLILFSIIITFILLGIRNKINIYDNFIEGAKEGFSVAIKIIPFLVAMLVAIGVFRASGALDFIMDGFKHFFSLFNINTDFVDALPTAFMKPLSGSGARGMMVETMRTFGADSFPAKLSGVFQGSTETTFYVLAVYYGAVNIKRTRHTLGCALFADFVGIIAAIFIAYLFFH